MPSQDVSVRPSVCLSHAGILLKRLDISSDFFSPSGSHTILAFPHEMVWQYSDENPLTGRRMQVGMKKSCDFRPISRFVSEIIQDLLFQCCMVTMEDELKTVPKLSSGSISNYLE